MKTSICDPDNTYYVNPLTLKDTWKKPKKTCFWIEMTLSEVHSHLFIDEEYLSLKKHVLRLWDEPQIHPNFYFWVAQDLSRLYQSFGDFPYSSFNNMKERYIYFDPIELSSLKDLQKIEIDTLKKVR